MEVRSSKPRVTDALTLLTHHRALLHKKKSVVLVVPSEASEPTVTLLRMKPSQAFTRPAVSDKTYNTQQTTNNKQYRSHGSSLLAAHMHSD